ncbi:DUF6895 family protein [Streptomyces flaveolus]|uniref:DUF6895 family protein n=1 Tax=Streptomyces flaveolus TaxID=67297 RepID=UPI0036FE78A6
MSTALAEIAHDIRYRALGWLYTHRQRGALVGNDLAQDMDASKALAETAVAASVILRGGTAGSQESAWAQALIQFAWAELKEGALLYERALHHPMATDVLEAYGHFARAGYRHPGLDRMIPHMAMCGAAHVPEYQPYQRLAAASALRLSGHDHGLNASDWHRWATDTWLGRTPAPWLLDWSTGYAVTHTVFHLTDWGRDPAGLPRNMAAYLTRWLPVWTDVWSEVCQWDLVGELLFVGCCLPEPSTELGDWQHLAEIQHSDGLMPADSQDVDDDPAVRFTEHQHSTIVAAVASTTALTRALDGAFGQHI